ncbi:MAG: S41 family peptidase [Armatimonadota bacterium]
MKTSSRLMLIFMVILFSFICGFTYRDIGTSEGIRGTFKAVKVAYNTLESTITEAIEGPKLELPPIETYWNTFSYLDSNYFGKRVDLSGKKITSREMTYNAIRGMLKSLGDRYTRFLDPEDFDRIQQENRGDFEGIGAELDVQNGRTFIKKPIKGSPAVKAGLHAGDIILKVDEHLIQGMDIDEVVKLIRGKGGTKVHLTIKRKDVPKPMVFTIIRDTIPFTIVESKMADDAGKIGYIALRQFNEKSDQQFDEAMSDLEEKGMRGLILDLRGNPGGLLDVAVEVGSRFIDNGDIVIIKQGERETPLEVDPRQHNHKMYPLAVLINGSSASASEILAGAIQDHKVGTIIGTESFGKGLVQTIINLEDGSAVSITTAKYLTPAGRDVNKNKIQPDIVVEQPKLEPKPQKNGQEKSPDDIVIVNEEENDVQLKSAIKFLKDKMSQGQTNTASNKVNEKS